MVSLFYQISRKRNETNSNDRGVVSYVRQELRFLKNERRPEIIKAIAEAREHGDLKENENITLRVNNKVFAKDAFKKLKANLQIVRLSMSLNYQITEKLFWCDSCISGYRY